MIISKLAKMIEGKGTRIVFTEGWDPRVMGAAVRLKEDNLVKPVLLGEHDEVNKCAADNGFNLEGIEVIAPSEFPAEEKEKMVTRMIELRRGKLDHDAASALLDHTNYFGTMLVEMGYADGLLGGATYSTADTVRPALQLVKTAPGQSIVSSTFILVKGSEQLFMADCAINRDPNPDELVEIAIQTAATAKKFGVEPKVAMLSYSSFGSATGHCVAKMDEATTRLKRMPIGFDVDGEMQFDCAVSPEVAKLKAPDSKVAGQANTFIFPNLSSGNIGYKIAARLGGWEALGPILQGLNAPINDLSRGANEEEIYKMAIVTAAQKVSKTEPLPF
ncbi:phosphate acetyltransferase [Erysipelotrichaceae bacterium 51-3]